MTGVNVTRCHDEFRRPRSDVTADQIWNQSEYGAVVGKFYIRQRVFGTVVRQVTAAAMPYYQTLSEFERGVIVTARDMGHSISKLEEILGEKREDILEADEIATEDAREVRVSHNSDINFIKKRRIKWVGRVVRKNERDHHSEKVFNAQPISTRRKGAGQVLDRFMALKRSLSFDNLEVKIISREEAGKDFLQRQCPPWTGDRATEEEGGKTLKGLL
ncbi:uncharacterized protein TNCV_1303031, partial [Trichonephila clavipes]